MDRLALEAIDEIRSQFAGRTPEVVERALRDALDVRNVELEEAEMSRYCEEITAATPPDRA